MKNKFSVYLLLILLLLIASSAVARAQDPTVAQENREIGSSLGLWTGLPFLGILLSIALFPLFAPHFWHRWYPLVALAWAVLFAVPFIHAYDSVAIEKILEVYFTDYFPFIILLWALFTISGGILVRGTLAGNPIVNSLLLLIGTGIASWIGTTGASMLLIRPLIRTNAKRRNKTHLIVFFIFLVSNIGGSLSPLGDPPLFLGFIHGVPFFWTFNLLPEMAFLSLILLVLFFCLDSYFYLRERRKELPTVEETHVPLQIVGLNNLKFLGGVIAGVLLSGIWHGPSINVLGVGVPLQNIARDVILLAMGAQSLRRTPREIRRENQFTWGPIAEVGFLFAGIFMTIIPVIEILKAGEHGALAGLIRLANEPAHYFWLTGFLSSFLDNAPTYLTFFNTALGSLSLDEPTMRTAMRLAHEARVEQFGPEVAAHIDSFMEILKAIACGAVFMGANTYIGNAPNFMVKSIAEESGIRMPTFISYITHWSLPILIPAFVLMTIFFF